MMKKIRSRSADSNKSGASKFEGEELDTESFTEAEERIRALGEVTEHLDKKEVSGEILDDAIKSLFDKYTKDREKDKVDPTQLLFGCKVNFCVRTNIQLHLKRLKIF